jgi:hypothetical protein
VVSGLDRQQGLLGHPSLLHACMNSIKVVGYGSTSLMTRNHLDAAKQTPLACVRVVQERRDFPILLLLLLITVTGCQ